MRDEYLPFLSTVLMADGMISVPIEAVIRKGKSHYVCDQRLERRLGQLDLRKKNWRAGNALLSLREKLDLDEAPRLSGYDRERVCVPKVCDCGREDCRYLAFLDSCDGGQYPFQICNHNLLLADAIHRGTDRQPILPDSLAVIIDEAHKLPETARQIADATEQSHKVSVLQSRGLLDAGACSIKLRDIEAKLAELRRERRRLLKNDDLEEVMDCGPTSVQEVQDELSGGSYKADALTDFLDEVAGRCQFRNWFLGHYHTNTVIRKKSAVLYEQIIRLNL